MFRNYLFSLLWSLGIIAIFQNTLEAQLKKQDSHLLISGNRKYISSSCYPSGHQAYHNKNDLILAEGILYECLLKEVTNQNTEKSCQIIAEIFSFTDLIQNQSPQFTKILEIAKNLLSSEKSKELKWILSKSLAEYHCYSNNENEAVNFATLSYNLAKEINSLEKQCVSLTLMGKAFHLNKSPNEALHQFLGALFLAYQSDNIELKFITNKEISDFYLDMNILDKSILYKNELNDILKDQNTFDSLTYFHNRLELLDLISLKNNGEYDISALTEITHFASQNGFRRLFNFAMAFLRTSFLDYGKYELLLLTLKNQYPEEYQRLKSEDTLNYYRLNAYYFQSQNHKDSAQYYYSKFIPYTTTTIFQNGFISIAFKKYADFLSSYGNSKKAEFYYKASLSHANLSRINSYILSSLSALIGFYKSVGNYKEGFQHLENFNKINNEILLHTHDEEIFKLESDYQEKILDESRKKKLTQQLHHHQTQYDLIAIFIVLVFLGLMLMVQYKMPVWLIRSLGFLSFIFLFEFLIIKLDKQIHQITHEVPWKLFSIKVIIIAILLPLHHYVEKKALHFLVHKREGPDRLVKLNPIQSLKKWFIKLNSPE
ncbi:MAG: hypothetical protein IPM48_01165 [Saprospiraceae bacterium]|nr:hypothetical protein [Saprospiraceae bacterium]